MRALSQITIDPKLVFELAAQVETPQELATRYEVDEDELQSLLETPHIKRLIREKRAELEKSGYTLAAKAKLCFEDLLSDIYVKATRPDSPLGAVLDAAKFMRTVAGLDRNDAALPGERFSIQINFGGQTAIPAAVTTFDMDAEDASSVALMNLPVKPLHLAGVRVFGNSLAYAESM